MADLSDVLAAGSGEAFDLVLRDPIVADVPKQNHITPMAPLLDRR